MAQGLRTFVKNSRLRYCVSSRGHKIIPRLDEDEELIFRRETLPLDAIFHE
jgi:hypothetical protein